MKAVFTFIGLVILLAVGVFVGRTTGLPIPSIPSILPTSGPTATPKIITGAGVIKQIQHLNRLESTSYTIETVITAERAGGWFGIGSEKLLMVVHGRVIAGIDLSKLQLQDVTISEGGRAVDVQLPSVEILSQSLDETKTQVYDYKKGWFTSHDPNLETLARQQGVAKILASACEDGIKEQGEKDAQQAMGQLLTALGFEHISIKITNPTTPICSPSTVATPRP